MIEPGSEKWHRRVAELAEETSAPSDSLWWLSFVGDHGFLGACLVAAPNMPAAVTVSHMLGINPGGEVAIKGPIPAEAAVKLPERFRNCLMSRQEIAEMDTIMKAGG